MASPALAGGRKRARGPAKADKLDRAELILSFDKNRDGKLDAGERKALRAEIKRRRQARKQKLLTRFDANGNGRIDGAERAAVRKARVQRVFERMDANGDGVIDRAEFERGARKLRRRR